MSRRRAAAKRNIQKDAKYSSILLSKFINYIMQEGKKHLACKIVYGALDILETKYSKSPLQSFNVALENLKPMLEVKPIRVGASTYQVPCALEESRAVTLSMKWLIKASGKRAETTMKARIAEELFDALNNRGSAIKIKEDTHKMAEANRSYAHFSPRRIKT